jgi:predicted Fe-Mo cluster-binding NifX family protein
MKLAISLQEDKGMDSTVSPIFGSSPYFMFVDADNGFFQIRPTLIKPASGTPETQNAQMVANKNVDAVISNKFGQKAYEVLNSAGIWIYIFLDSIVEEALKAFRRGQLAAYEPAGTRM